MAYVFAAPPQVVVPVAGSTDVFPVHRIYCVGRNYEEHAKEMGFSGREPPFFFAKPADAVLPVVEPPGASLAEGGRGGRQDGGRSGSVSLSPESARLKRGQDAV